MKTLYKFPILLLVVVLFSSCISTMKVKVEVIDRTKLMTSPEILFAEVKAMSQIQQVKLQDKHYHNQRDRIYNSFEKITQALLEKKAIDSKVQTNLQNSLKEDIDEVYFKKVIPKILTGIATYESIYRRGKIDENSLTKEQVETLIKAKSDFSTAFDTLHKNIMRWGSLDSTLKKFTNPSDKETTSFIVNSLIDEVLKPTLSSIYKENKKMDHLSVFHNGLYNDPLNSIVAGAEDEYWKKIYNKAAARNFMGNTDIALVMETPGNFFIKGVRMDAENVTNTLAKTFNEGIKLLAKVNGLPVTSQGVVDTSQLNKQNDVISKNINQQKMEQEIEINDNLTRLSAINLMSAIIAQKDALESDTEYKEALIQIQNIYKVHKAQYNSLKSDK